MMAWPRKDDHFPLQSGAVVFHVHDFLKEGSRMFLSDVFERQKGLPR